MGSPRGSQCTACTTWPCRGGQACGYTCAEKNEHVPAECPLPTAPSAWELSRDLARCREDRTFEVGLAEATGTEARGPIQPRGKRGHSSTWRPSLRGGLPV